MQYLNRVLFNFRIGLTALLTNRMRALLTSLGIIFGVASVIAMLAIGRGAEKEILEQIRQVGSNNIVVKANIPSRITEEGNSGEKQEGDEQKTAAPVSIKRNASPGLQLADVENLLEIKSIDYISPEAEIPTELLFNGITGKGTMTGIRNSFFDITNTKLSKGLLFSQQHHIEAVPVCIIGWNIEKKYFAGINPIGQYFKCGREWLKIVGVMQQKNTAGKDAGKLSIRNINDEVFIPLTTMLMRYRNLAAVTVSKIQMGRNSAGMGGNYHQLDKLVVHVSSSEKITATVDIITRMLQRRHAGVRDFEIIVPELLLKQEQKTKQLFNVVLAIIASISLIVGGIGIMNIMLASVLERTREIGLRLAIGATKRDVVQQFLSEAISLCVAGGLIGVILGVSISMGIKKMTGIETVVSLFSVVLSFSISAMIGLLFGWYPARRAASNDPVVSLRGE